jgi:hypothetical protein
MRRTLHAPHSPLPDDRSGLGHEHPFVRATEQVTVAIDQCVAVSALLVVGVLALIDGLAVGPPLALASATVLVALMVGLGGKTTARDLRALDALCAEAARPAEQCHAIRPIYDPRVVSALSAELAEVARLVRDGGGLRGLARAERLVIDGGSALYGSSEEAFRQELRHIRFLLAS